MPGDDGLGLIGMMRSLPSEFGVQIPAIALAAMTGKKMKTILADGFQLHLLKSTEANELAATVSSVINNVRS